MDRQELGKEFVMEVENILKEDNNPKVVSMEALNSIMILLLGKCTAVTENNRRLFQDRVNTQRQEITEDTQDILTTCEIIMSFLKDNDLLEKLKEYKELKLMKA